MNMNITSIRELVFDLVTIVMLFVWEVASLKSDREIPYGY